MYSHIEEKGVSLMDIKEKIIKKFYLDKIYYYDIQDFDCEKSFRIIFRETKDSDLKWFIVDKCEVG